MCTFLLQNGAVRDMGLVPCEIGLFNYNTVQYNRIMQNITATCLCVCRTLSSLWNFKRHPIPQSHRRLIGCLSSTKWRTQPHQEKLVKIAFLSDCLSFCLLSAFLTHPTVFEPPKCQDIVVKWDISPLSSHEIKTWCFTLDEEEYLK